MAWSIRSGSNSSRSRSWRPHRGTSARVSATAILSTTWFRKQLLGKSKSPACTGDTLIPSDRGAFPNLTSLEQARRIADLAQEKLARDVLILDMRPVCTYTEYFVVCTGNNPRQAKAIYDEVREGMKRESRVVPRHVHGERDANWILADYLDVVLHVFTPEARDYYRLEELWGDVPSVDVAATARELLGACAEAARQVDDEQDHAGEDRGVDPEEMGAPEEGPELTASAASLGLAGLLDDGTVV